jgi:hypothetical protein
MKVGNVEVQLVSSRIYEDMFIEVMAEIQEERPDLVPVTVQVTDHGLSCSWRRMAMSVALAQEVDATGDRFHE